MRTFILLLMLAAVGAASRADSGEFTVIGEYCYSLWTGVPSAIYTAVDLRASSICGNHRTAERVSPYENVPIDFEKALQRCNRGRVLTQAKATYICAEPTLSALDECLEKCQGNSSCETRCYIGGQW